VLPTSASANLMGSPTTKTRFRCTTLTLARCFRFSVIFCFLCWSLCLFSAFRRATSSWESGLKSAGFSGYALRQAGHRPFSSVRIRCQQKRHIWESKAKDTAAVLPNSDSLLSNISCISLQKYYDKVKLPSTSTCCMTNLLTSNYMLSTEFLRGGVQRSTFTGSFLFKLQTVTITNAIFFTNVELCISLLCYQCLYLYYGMTWKNIKHRRSKMKASKAISCYMERNVEKVHSSFVLTYWKTRSMNLSSERTLIRNWQATYLDSSGKYYKNMQSKNMMETINFNTKITVHVYLIKDNNMNVMPVKEG